MLFRSEADQQLDDEGRVIDDGGRLASDDDVIILDSGGGASAAEAGGSASDVGDGDTLFGGAPTEGRKRRSPAKRKKTAGRGRGTR